LIIELINGLVVDG